MLLSAAWPAAALAATIGGVVAGGHLRPGPGRGAFVVATVAAAAAVLARRSRGVLTFLTVAALATAVTMRARDGVAAGAARAEADGRTRMLSVDVVRDPDPSPFQTRAVVRLHGHHVLAVAARPASSHLAVVTAGDRLLLRGHLAPLTGDEANRWRHRHVGARLVVEDVLDLDGPHALLLRAANAVRGAVLSGTGHLPSPEGGLVAGFLVGDTRAVPDWALDDFRHAGLSHLLAVSGANVAFVLALTGPPLRWLGLRSRLVGHLTVVLLFAAVTRFEPSVLRASAVAAIAGVAWFLGRPALGVRVLALAMTGLLLIDPFLLDSLGFRLSCAASAGILLWAGPIVRRLPGPAALRETLAVTTAAQLGVAPVLLPAFGSMPVAALPANLLAVPLAAPLTVWGLLSGLAGAAVGGWLPELAALLQVPTLLLARAITGIAAAGAAVPLTIDATIAWGLTALVCSVAAVRQWSRRLGADGDQASPRTARV